MDFRSHKSPQGEGDVAHLGSGRPDLSFLHAAALLEAPMVVLDRPGFPRQTLPLIGAQGQVVSRPVFRVPIWSDGPKHLDEPVALEMYLFSLRPDVNGANGSVTLPIRVHLPVGLELPATASRGTYLLEVLQRAVPAIKEQVAWLEAPALGLSPHISEMLVLFW
jgi:hypothetical protein